MAKELVDQAIAAAENLDLMAYPRRPASLAVIEECQASIGYTFPRSYRHFLEICGFLGMFGTEFYGLISDDLNNPSHLNAYLFTKEMQENWNFPKELFAFENFDGDAVACLLLSHMVGDECPVILWDHSEAFDRQLKKPHFLAQSFGEYLLIKAKQAIKDEGLT